MIFTYGEYVNMDDFVISNLHEARNEWCSRSGECIYTTGRRGITFYFRRSMENVC